MFAVRSSLGNGKHAVRCVPMSVIFNDIQENNSCLCHTYISLPLLSLACWVFEFVVSELQEQATSITSVRTYRGATYDRDCYLMKSAYRARIKTRKLHYEKEREKISLEELWKDSVGDECRKKLNKAWTDKEVEKEVNIDLETQCRQIKTRMKNIAVDMLEFEERKKDNKEWFTEECRQLLEQKNKSYQGIFSWTNESKRSGI